MNDKAIKIYPNVPLWAALECVKAYRTEAHKEGTTGIESLIEYSAAMGAEEWKIHVYQSKTLIIVRGADRCAGEEGVRIGEKIGSGAKP